MERLSEKAIDIINELHTERLDYNSEYLPLIEAANSLAAYENSGMEPCDYSAMSHALQQAKRAREDLTEMIRIIGGAGLDRLKELAEADKAGRLLILDDETALALAAVVYGCDTNRRLIGATHMWDFRGRCGGPKQITYSRAIQKLNGLAENVLNKGGESDGT